MIPEVLEPFLNVSMAILLWGFVAFQWVIALELVRDNTWPYRTNVVIAGLTVVMPCAQTIILFLWTLTIMGVV